MKGKNSDGEEITILDGLEILVAETEARSVCWDKPDQAELVFCMEFLVKPLTISPKKRIIKSTVLQFFM